MKKQLFTLALLASTACTLHGAYSKSNHKVHHHAKNKMMHALNSHVITLENNMDEGFERVVIQVKIFDKHGKGHIGYVNEQDLGARSQKTIDLLQATENKGHYKNTELMRAGQRVVEKACFNNAVGSVGDIYVRVIEAGSLHHLHDYAADYLHTSNEREGRLVREGMEPFKTSDMLRRPMAQGERSENREHHMHMHKRAAKRMENN